MTACGPLSGSSDSESGSSAATELTISVRPNGNAGPTKTWTLRCDPTGGSLPRAAAACERLTAKALKPLPADTICTQIYGGPQQARVRGSFRGRPVDSRFSRANGCEIHRWDELRYLFPVRI
jgi:Subtilisin inhibitor-like